MRVHDCFALDHVNQHVCTLGALGLGVWDSNSDQACHDMVTRASEREGVECSLTTTIETTTTATITTNPTFFSPLLLPLSLLPNASADSLPLGAFAIVCSRMSQLIRYFWMEASGRPRRRQDVP